MVSDQVLPRAATQPCVSQCHFSSFLDQEKALPKFDQKYRQMTAGAFEGTIKSLDFGAVTLTRERLNQGLEQHSAVHSGTVAVGFLMGSGIMHDLSKDETLRGEAMLLPGGYEHISYVEGESDWVIASIAQDVLPDDMLQGRVLAPEVARPVGAWMRTLIEVAGSGAEAQGLMTLVPDLVMDRLSLLFGHPAQDGLRHNRREAQLFRRILNACEELPPEELTVSGLSRALGCTRADLRGTCLSVTGFRLDDMLTARRLSDVYRVLRGARVDAVNVTQTALNHGFTHFGRFSVAYRQMFGERPSDTLRA